MRETIDAAFERSAVEKIGMENLSLLISHVQERFGWEIERTVAADVPDMNDIAKQVLLPAHAGALEYLATHCSHGLFIKDTFTHDDERRQFFREVLGKQGVTLKQHSKLSANNWVACLYIMEGMWDVLQKEGVQIPFDRQRISDFRLGIPAYQDFAFEGKVSFIKNLDSIIRDFLTALSQAQVLKNAA